MRRSLLPGLLVVACMSCFQAMAWAQTPAAQVNPAQSSAAAGVPVSGKGGPPAQNAAATPSFAETLPTSPPSRLPSRPTESRFLIVLDPAHGGADPGALLGADGPEKNYALAMALHLQALLNARGIHSLLTRNADTTLPGDARAQIANRAHASACILLHATASGSGVHLFTSSLPPAAAGVADASRAFLPWRTAQASYATPSLQLESDINAALARQHIPALLGRTSLTPLDNMACPAVALEVAPLDATTPLTDSVYQQQIVGSLVSALAEWRSDWRPQP